MISNINGQQYYDLLDYGIRNLSIYKDRVNGLNVFPVPDGDTGTNMLVTLQTGLRAVSDGEKELSDVSRRFARAVSFGARGNSGVIVSQFFKGLSETFYDITVADLERFALALENGVRCAYMAVPNPVEGTILTVVREATDFVRRELKAGKIHNLNDLVEVFLNRARESLEHTPDLLEVLRSAGVVDSGGAGVVYLFEGMNKYLNNEVLPEVGTDAAVVQQAVDYSGFNRSSVFEFGYCTEFLLQLLDGRENFDYDCFRDDLGKLGESLVTVFETDKVKVHIHTHTPEVVLQFCHRYGEFLALKIENMSVQHQEQYVQEGEGESASFGEGNPFSVVAVAHNPAMKQRFLDMGADRVILADYQNPPMASDFLAAFESSVPDTVLVFPNNKNTELAAIQAQRLCETKIVRIVGTRSDAQCYAALPMIDFSCDCIEEVLAQVDMVVENLDIVLVSHAGKNSSFDGNTICEGDYVALCDHDLKAVAPTISEVSLKTIEKVLAEKECEVITMFTGKGIPDDTVETICSYVAENYIYTEITVVETDDVFYKIVFCFE